MRSSAVPDQVGLELIAGQIIGIQPYLPLLVIEPKGALPENAIPFSQASGNWDRLLPRLRAALRVRTLHATVLRRRSDQPVKTAIAEIDPVRDATVLLIGRAGAYPALSVALGERMGVVGALSIEAAASFPQAEAIEYRKSATIGRGIPV